MANGVTAGASLGASLGSFLGPAGTIGGGLLGGFIGAIPSLTESEAERANRERLAKLRKDQEMGALGLTEAEKQSLYGAGSSAVQGQMQQLQALSRAAGASGMQTGAGNELLKQAAAAERAAGLQADVARNVETKDLERKRELEKEIEARVAAKSLADQERKEAIFDAALGGIGSGVESLISEANALKGVGLPTDATSAAKIKGLSDSDIQAWGKSYNLMGADPSATRKLVDEYLAFTSVE